MALIFVLGCFLFFVAVAASLLKFLLPRLGSAYVLKAGRQTCLAHSGMHTRAHTHKRTLQQTLLHIIQTLPHFFQIHVENIAIV